MRKTPTTTRFRRHMNVVATLVLLQLLFLLLLFQHQIEIQSRLNYGEHFIGPPVSINATSSSHQQQPQQQGEESNRRTLSSTRQKKPWRWWSRGDPTNNTITSNPDHPRHITTSELLENTIDIAASNHSMVHLDIFCPGIIPWSEPHFENISPHEDSRLEVDAWYHSFVNPPWSTATGAGAAAAGNNGGVLHQTLCHESSRFRNPQNNYESDDDDWHIRLLYWGMYLHQHLPAWKEMKTRRACQSKNNNIHNHPSSHLPRNHNSTTTTATAATSSADYHCDSSTKFLVATLTTAGAGATFRNSAAPALLAGLASGRVVLFVNERPYGRTESMQQPWTLASRGEDCSRADYQCFFLPVTPCVVTEADMKRAINRQRQWEEQTNVTISLADLLRQGKGSVMIQDERIVVIETEAMPLEPDLESEKRIRKRIYDLIVQNNGTANKKRSSNGYLFPNTPAAKVLEEILLLPYAEYDKKKYNQRLQQKTKLQRRQGRFGSKFHQATSTLHHAALLYILRSNWKFQQQLDQDLRQAIPADFDAEWSFGLPIRASDKCSLESMCLTFEQYMELTKQQYKKYSNATRPKTNKKIANVILTSESASILALRHKYIHNSSSEFPFRFVVNDKDVAQGHGQPEYFDEKGANKVMRSTMVAFKLQLMAKYTVVNCCSSFHRMILDMLRSGCGAAPEPEYRCLDETDDPQFHICCHWDGGQKCQQARKEFREKYLARPDDYGGLFKSFDA